MYGIKHGKVNGNRNRADLEEGFHDFLDDKDMIGLGADYYLDDEECIGGHWCSDGLCDRCNWTEYTEWMNAHSHCDMASFDCPDPDICPHNTHLVAIPANRIVIGEDNGRF